MSRALFFFLLLFYVGKVQSQTINSVTIIPSNPDDNDSVYLALDFSYQGNCSFGLVYHYTSITGDTILAAPTYCGYMDTSNCNSLDTINIGVFPAGSYTLLIEFHQGSVCPISGFDATIALLDTTLSVSTFSGITDLDKSGIQIFPNPAGEKLHLLLEDNLKNAEVTLINSGGQLVYKSILKDQFNIININSLSISGGLYTVIINTDGHLFHKRVMIE